MKRITLCFWIIVGIIISSVFSLRSLASNNKEIFAKIDRIEELYEQDSEDVQVEISELEDYWHKYYIRHSYFSQSAALDDVSVSIAKLRYNCESNPDEFIPECESIKYRVKIIYDRQFPHLHTVL